MSRLLLCRRCYALWGCDNGRVRRCRACTSHDCPLLPAPAAARGECDTCRECREDHPPAPSPEAFPAARAGRA